MAETIPESWRFVKAADTSTDPIDFEGLDVRSIDDESVGNVRGFVVDAAAQRLHYVVIDSGGWFSGGSYLIPPAYTRLDAENRVLWTDLTKDTILRFPEFDESLVSAISRDNLWAIERRIISAYGDDPGVVAPSADWERDTWPHYGQPSWWRDRRIASPAGSTAPHVAEAAGHPRRDFSTRGDEPRKLDETPLRDEPSDAVARARPGDVLGIERAGETTSLGDTAEDEDRRRRGAEEEFREVRDEIAEEQRKSGIAADRPRRPER